MLLLAPFRASASASRSLSAGIPPRHPPPLILGAFSDSTHAMIALTSYRGASGTQPKIFSRQHELPRLRVPPLEQTFKRYLKSLEPSLAQKEELGQLPRDATAASELARRKQHISAFLASSLSAQLQQRLIDVDRITPDNWIDDRFWLQKAYHEWRVPLLVNPNWWIMFTNDLNTPAGLADHPGHGSGELSPAKGAAALGESRWDEAQCGIRRVARPLDDASSPRVLPKAEGRGHRARCLPRSLYGISRIPALPGQRTALSAHHCHCAR
ncbi:hypothetical protein V8E36_002600 [Tilletia maclaganii]